MSASSSVRFSSYGSSMAVCWLCTGFWATECTACCYFDVKVEQLAIEASFACVCDPALMYSIKSMRDTLYYNVKNQWAALDNRGNEELPKRMTGIAVYCNQFGGKRKKKATIGRQHKTHTMLFNNMHKQEMWGVKEWIFPSLDSKSQCFNDEALSLFITCSTGRQPKCIQNKCHWILLILGPWKWKWCLKLSFGSGFHDMLVNQKVLGRNQKWLKYILILEKTNGSSISRW